LGLCCLCSMGCDGMSGLGGWFCTGHCPEHSVGGAELGGAHDGHAGPPGAPGARPQPSGGVLSTGSLEFRNSMGARASGQAAGCAALLGAGAAGSWWRLACAQVALCARGAAASRAAPPARSHQQGRARLPQPLLHSRGARCGLGDAPLAISRPLARLSVSYCHASVWRGGSCMRCRERWAEAAACSPAVLGARRGGGGYERAAAALQPAVQLRGAAQHRG
jgi:hypothetical protein